MKLVQLGLERRGHVQPQREGPTGVPEALYKKAVLVERGSFRPEYLDIFSRDVLKKIAAGDAAWEQMVPAAVAAMVKDRHFFGAGL